MKSINCLIVASLTILLAGCKDDVVSAGAGTLTSEEEVRVRATTFDGISSASDALNDFRITQTPDSFLVGECHTDMWGTIQADLLAQFACPEGAQFPDSSQIDSVAFAMTYSSYFGDGLPLLLSVFEMDGEPLIYDQEYSSQEPLDTYWSGDVNTLAAEERIVVASQPSDSVYSSALSRYLPYVRFKMNQRIVDKMNSLPNKTFPSQTIFNQWFKGLYIRSSWGTSTALYVGNLTMMVYFHYFYETTPGTFIRKNDIKYLYANHEVRQVNRYTFPEKDSVVQIMQRQQDSVNYIVSPGYVHTVLNFPVGRYVQTIKDSMQTTRGDRLRPYVNRAVMHVDVLDVENASTLSGRWAKPANDMLLINKDSMQAFFSENRLPDSEYCLISTLGKSVDSLNTYRYYYNFDLATIMQQALRSNNCPDVVQLVMIPVNVEYTVSNSTTLVSKITINQTITFTKIRSAQILDDPMDIDMVYSGFWMNGMY